MKYHKMKYHKMKYKHIYNLTKIKYLKLKGGGDTESLLSKCFEDISKDPLNPISFDDIQKYLETFNCYDNVKYTKPYGDILFSILETIIDQILNKLKKVDDHIMDYVYSYEGEEVTGGYNVIYYYGDKIIRFAKNACVSKIDIMSSFLENLYQKILYTLCSTYDDFDNPFIDLNIAYNEDEGKIVSIMDKLDPIKTLDQDDLQILTSMISNLQQNFAFIHGDLKLSNIMRKDLNIYLIDLGFCSFHHNGYQYHTTHPYSKQTLSHPNNHNHDLGLLFCNHTTTFVSPDEESYEVSDEVLRLRNEIESNQKYKKEKDEIQNQIDILSEWKKVSSQPMNIDVCVEIKNKIELAVDSKTLYDITYTNIFDPDTIQNIVGERNITISK